MNYADIKKIDVANGEGVRVSLFVSGCNHHCKGCFNQCAWDFNYGDKFTEKEEQKIIEYMDHDYIEGLSLLGGEPLEPKNQEGLLPLVKDIKEKGDKTEAARQWMCRNFYDIRTFGAVLSTGENAGQVRGPIQFTFARSISPIVTAEHSITRMAVATEDEAKKQSGDNRTMGRKFTVPYGLYKANGFISAHLAAQTGFNDEDLNLFWDSLKNMFDHDHSAARGMMNARKLIVFKHSTALGNASAHSLFGLVKVQLKDDQRPPRSFDDYIVTIDKDKLPEGVEVLDMI